MASSEPPLWEPPSRRRIKANKNSLAPVAESSRAARGRDRRERQLERQFGWLFALAVGGTILYLLSRTPLGIAWLHTSL